jgi:hypothetical protein
MKKLSTWSRLAAGVAVSALSIPGAGVLAGEKPLGIGVFVVTSTELQSGLMEKDEADSKKDLEGKIRNGRKNVWLAPSREAAQLVLVIAGRGIVDSGAYIPGSTSTTVQATSNDTLTAKTTTNPNIPIYVTNVRADVYLSTDGRHLRAFLGDGLTWKGAANDVAKQIDSWVGLNRQALERMHLEARMAAVEKAFKARHPELTPELERKIVELGNSGQVPLADMTPDEYLENLYSIVLSRQARN